MTHCRRCPETTLSFVCIICGSKTIFPIYIPGNWGILFHSQYIKVGNLKAMFAPGNGNLTINDDAGGWRVCLWHVQVFRPARSIILA